MAFVVNASPGIRIRCLKQPSTTEVRTNAHHSMCAASGNNGCATRRAVLSALAGTAAAVAAAAVAPSPALADHTLVAAKRAFERYYPRISAGGSVLREIGADLSKGNASAVTAAVDAREFDVKFRRALGIYASSFSDNYVGQKTRDLQTCTDRLFDELAAMKTAADADEALEHYSMAVEAYRKYIKIARLPRESAEGFENAKAVVMK